MRMIWFIIILELATTAYCSTEDDNVLKQRLFNDVLVADYDNAVETTKTLNKERRTNLIKAVLENLLSSSVRNTMEYAYKLWQNGGQNIVEDHFPIEFRLLFGNKLVDLVNKHFGLAMKLDSYVHSDGDRGAFGDGTDAFGTRAAWKFVPFWDNNNLYFKIINNNHKQYLKLGYEADSAGDRKAYGTNNEVDFRTHWYLHPVKHNGYVLFYIFNRHFDQALKEGYATDNYGDRIVWGHNGHVIDQPNNFAWFLTAH